MSKEKGVVDEQSLLSVHDDKQHPAQSNSNADTVSLSNTSLSKALEIQQSTSTLVGGSDCPPYEFKQEGHRMQFNFNQNHLNKLSEIEEAVRSSDIVKVLDIISDQKAAFTKRNIILKIADRHGWDTVNEYLDVPFADNNDDAIKLRNAVNKAKHKRYYRYRPYNTHKAEMFSQTAFFPGIGRVGRAALSPTCFRFPGQEFMSCVGAIPRDGNCYYYRHLGLIVRECPLTRGQAVQTPASANVTTSSRQWSWVCRKNEWRYRWSVWNWSKYWAYEVFIGWIRI